MRLPGTGRLREEAASAEARLPQSLSRRDTAPLTREHPSLRSETPATALPTFHGHRGEQPC